MRKRTPRVGIGLLAFGLVAVIAGPLFATHPVDRALGIPFSLSEPSGGPLGTDLLGRDVLSRFLVGGRDLTLIALAVAIVSTIVGAVIGLIAATRGGLVGAMVERTLEVALALPAVLVLLLVGAGLEEVGMPVLILVLSALAIPWVARVVVASAAPVLATGFVEHARLTGEATVWIAVREVLPNLRHTLLALGALRFAEAVAVVSAAAFLGVGAPPPAANWAVMVRENAAGLSLNPWATIAPGLAIALLTAGVTIVADRSARSR